MLKSPCTGKLIRYCTMAETLEIFDVDRWLRQPRPAELHVSQPYQVACWSKSSFNEGGDTCHGDTAGKSCVPRRPSYSVPAQCISSAAGLHPFEPPELPADLGQGYPEAYVQKDEDLSVGVEPVVSAVAKVCVCCRNTSESCDPIKDSLQCCRPACKINVIFAPSATI